MKLSRFCATFAVLMVPVFAVAADPSVVLDGKDGPGKGKHIVLISGDQEYRSEETIPQLAKILSKHHGFKCTVLFTVDPKDGTINPHVHNIPGLEALKTADLMVIFTRFLALPDEQLQHIDSYLASGKPVWRVERKERPVWATPTLHLASGRTELLVVGGLNVRGYDPRTGKELWRFKDEAEVKTPTPFVADGLVIFAGGYRGRPIYAIREGASGDVSVPPDAKSGPSLAWRTEPGGS